ncbi:hypothetical protein O3G_MSEX005873 [Manduca sexta]|uniref:Cytosolic fatty-acid binding proteins domain-containing protein n=1 Tax=Manduca sexta TaxID=7130 RepID=A0A921Z2L7_MANSE|nr:hypothetical protein O3G_MSEX005873 [Manduca sexta]
MAYLGKVYKFDREENFDGFLKSLSEEQVQKYLQYKPSSQLVKEGDKYKYISVSSDGTKETVFESGVETDDVVQGGLPIKTTYTVDGNTVTQVVNSAQGSATFKREYNGDELKVTITSSEWDGVAYRYYKA